jgi:hypothetical protein
MQQIWKVVDTLYWILGWILGFSHLDRGQTQLPPLQKATHSTPSLLPPSPSRTLSRKEKAKQSCIFIFPAIFLCLQGTTAPQGTAHSALNFLAWQH